MFKIRYCLCFLCFVFFIFSYKFFIFQEVPISSDTISGMYHPFIDSYKHKTGSMMPVKNFLITDPVRQTYVWKKLSIDLIKQGKLPFWNPYNFSGSPLMANWQSGAFYPANLLFLFFSFNYAWGIFILLQLFLSSFFTFLFLKNKKLSSFSSFLGAISFSFSGFMIAWLEWGNIGHTVLYLPLILYFVDRYFDKKKKAGGDFFNKHAFLIFLSLFLSFLAGHPQSFFYVVLASFFYSLWSLFLLKKKERLRSLKALLLPTIFFAFFIFPLIIPGIKYITLSARSIDISNVLSKDDWFLPAKHLLQFFVPDFFGHPSTLNYWGTWNYGEFIGYVGVMPLFLAMFSIFNLSSSKKQFGKKFLFWPVLFFLGLLIALKNPISDLPFLLKIPVLSTFQPSRLIFLISFSLSVLSAFGLEIILKKGLKKKHLVSMLLFFFVYVFLWLLVFLSKTGKINLIPASNFIVVVRNLILPSALAILILFDFIFFYFLNKKYGNKIKPVFIFKYGLAVFLLFFTSFDLLRFAWKFIPFNKEDTIFPETKIINVLKKDPEVFRILSTDRRIMPPNFATFYRLQDVSGYDPLYLQHYANFVLANENNSPELKKHSFNRIITPHNIDSKVFPLFNVKYILSLSKQDGSFLNLVDREGETYLYQNSNYLQRAFLVYKVSEFSSQKELLNGLFEDGFSLQDKALVYNSEAKENKKDVLMSKISEGDSVKIENYSENEISLKSKTKNDAFLVLLDSYYPSWKVRIDGVNSKIWQTNYSFRGVFVPAGEHMIKFLINNFL